MKPRILLVDDELAIVRGYARGLAPLGFDVACAGNGTEALAKLKEGPFDVIVSDIAMPDINGLELLAMVRRQDLDVPVIIMTGDPTLATAVRALENGALRYLQKPVDLDELQRVLEDAVRLHRIAKAKRQALAMAGGVEKLIGDQAGLEASFTRALDSLWMAYQPIVSWSEKKVFGYEALMRSTEPLLPHPGAVLDAAERLDRLTDLGRLVRARVATSIDALPDGVALFVNLHTHDLQDEELFAFGSPLASIAPRVILEITERASLHHVKDVQSRVARLRKLGFRIAVDDLGAGYAGLTSFALLEPEVVKLDMSLIRNVDREPTKRTLVKTMTSMCKELGMLVVAEGIETAAERDVLIDEGCDLFQGYLFARPEKPFPAVKW